KTKHLALSILHLFSRKISCHHGFSRENPNQKASVSASPGKFSCAIYILHAAKGMANDTRSGRKIKDDGNSISKGRHTGGNGVTSSSTESPDTSNLRRSSRETSSSMKNMISESSSSKKNTTSETPPLKTNVTPSPSSIRKSERIEKRTSTTAPVKRKSERLEKQSEPIPLRRSERGKGPSSSSSSGSKKSDKSLVSSELKQKKEKKEKNHNKELNKIEKSSQEYSSNCEDGSSEQVNDVRGTSSDAEQAQVECSTEENFLSPESLEYTTESRTLDDDIGLKRGQNVMHLKRKRNEVDMVSDSSAVVASKETCVSQADVNPLSPARSTGICGDKKQRYWIIQYLFGFRSLEFRSVNDLKVIK
ncbi:hypothetical protein CISIN_1g038620mg, partial [Citrus sinensis]